MRPCPDKRCHVPDVQCYLGEDTPGECAVWCRGAEGAAPPDAERAAGSATLPPWSGSALGTRDLSFLTGRGDAKLVAVLGGHNAGKTTLLAAWYQQIGRTGAAAGRRFAGSVTLEGWEAVAHALRWEAGAPQFPPHTSSGARRAPGMLHLALRDGNGRLEDFLFADSPGEWFDRWAVDRDARDAEGARWLAERATSFIVVADGEALSGPTRGLARNALVQLINRVADERRDRPVALVWTKADVAVPEKLREGLRQVAYRELPGVAEFSASVFGFERDDVSVEAAQSLRSVFDWSLGTQRRGFTLDRADGHVHDAFFDYGRV